MKFIIENKVYDTEKAECVCEFEKSVDKILQMFGIERTFREYKPAKLYKTKKDSWFSVADLGDRKRIILEDEISAKRIISSKHDIYLYNKYFDDLEEA
ncbi:hypothetical protein [Clostridium tyrobutyricum]|uniref:hypothetical protein n=1 Tax=Clostridium tyrobutyricum TaxID=1519 RepID=UPI001C38D543|nr:hypothetical protein [Clostridium tyrobutyricum]MBV4417182.1 hypothetical protein [Clostridium tyrobutyricum]